MMNKKFMFWLKWIKVDEKIIKWWEKNENNFINRNHQIMISKDDEMNDLMSWKWKWNKKKNEIKI